MILLVLFSQWACKRVQDTTSVCFTQIYKRKRSWLHVYDIPKCSASKNYMSKKSTLHQEKFSNDQEELFSACLKGDRNLSDDSWCEKEVKLCGFTFFVHVFMACKRQIVVQGKIFELKPVLYWALTRTIRWMKCRETHIWGS